MVRESSLSTALSDFARTLIADFPIQGILDHLVAHIIEILPVTGAGVTLLDADMRPRYIAASDDRAFRIERLQADSGQGPSLQAYASRDAVGLPALDAVDPAAATRFPDFLAAARDAGLGSMFAFPMRNGAGCVGALDVFCDASGVLDEGDLDVAQMLADMTAAYLVNAEAREEARRAAEYFRHRASHDPLTGLPNRLLLEQRLEHAAMRARRSHTNAAILFVDLDRFKQVNDTYGHHLGDELLVAVASRLQTLVRPGDTLSRFSGDEFVFLCEDLRSASDVELLAYRIADSFDSPFILAEVELAVTASVGMAYAGPGEEISQQLVAQADIAMYDAKRSGGAGHRVAVLDLRTTLHTADRIVLEQDLRAAFEREAFEVMYQPVVSSEDGAITGVEAQLRWTDPTRGVVEPAVVVGLAEQNGLINRIGAWVLERACRDYIELSGSSIEQPLEVAVRAFARQLMTPDFPATVKSVLTKTGMQPESLVLEITENIFVEDTDRATLVLSELKDLGVRLSLAEFGTGFSSLSHLQRLPVDIVKIDREFVASVGHADNGGAILAAVTNLAHEFGLEVTADGVDTQRQRDAVRLIGCETAQGRYFAGPMSRAELSALLQDSRGPVTLPQPAAVPRPRTESGRKLPRYDSTRE